MTTSIACPVCGSPSPSPVVELLGVPVFCNVLHDTRADAQRAALGDVRLVACSECGLLYNATFDAELARYAPGYENALHHSPTFAAFSEELARRLVHDHDLQGRTVVEIGPGDGSFLRSLVTLGAARGIGYDPSFAGDPAERGGVEIRAALFPADGADGADFVCARHVLEHLSEPTALVSTVAKALAPRLDGTFYVEVPDCTYMLERGAVWDVIYEHPTYFAECSLQRLLMEAGFAAVRSGRSFGDQYLYAEASITGGGSRAVAASDVDALLALAAEFGSTVRKAISDWDDELRRRAERGPVAVWGAGSKGVAFLNQVPSATLVQWVVDLNPRKHGRFVPGTGHTVVGPETPDGAPATVVVMNPIYVDEVREAVRELGWVADVIAVS
jgi:SAM-dependent methyltransferase